LSVGILGLNMLYLTQCATSSVTVLPALLWEKLSISSYLNSISEKRYGYQTWISIKKM